MREPVSLVTLGILRPSSPLDRINLFPSSRLSRTGAGVYLQKEGGGGIHLLSTYQMLILGKALSDLFYEKFLPLLLIRGLCLSSVFWEQNPESKP